MHVYGARIRHRDDVPLFNDLHAHSMRLDLLPMLMLSGSLPWDLGVSRSDVAHAAGTKARSPGVPDGMGGC